MSQRDLKSMLSITHLGALAVSGTTPIASDWVDLQGSDAVVLTLDTGTVTDAGTASGISVVMEESDTTADADATEVAAAEILGSLSDLTITADGDDDKLINGVGYVGNARYVRLKATGTTGSDAELIVRAITSCHSVQPPTFVGTSVAAT